MEHFNNVLFQKSGPANKQNTYQSINSTSWSSVAYATYRAEARLHQDISSRVPISGQYPPALHSNHWTFFRTQSFLLSLGRPTLSTLDLVSQHFLWNFVLFPALGVPSPSWNPDRAYHIKILEIVWLHSASTPYYILRSFFILISQKTIQKYKNIDWLIDW